MNVHSPDARERSFTAPLRAAFPRTIHEAHRFLSQRLLKAQAIDEATLSSIVEKLVHDEPLTTVEVSAMRQVTDIGDICTCDTDHRIREDDGAGGREVTFSSV